MDPFLPAPQPSRWHRGVYAAGLVIPFTAAQLWALLVLLRLAPLDGLVGQAMAVVLLGSVVAIWAGWRWIWRLGAERADDREPARSVRPR
ncbi:MAG TPA: hypothetical protein VJX66_14785 [Amycolatopsis sp.]|nr:hypothetical protein [Amycolatopsis sp.]